jgi:amidase
LDSLDKEGLKGARIGVVRQLFSETDADPEVISLMEQALIDMARQGAEIVEGVRTRHGIEVNAT